MAGMFGKYSGAFLLAGVVAVTSGGCGVSPFAPDSGVTSGVIPPVSSSTPAAQPLPSAVPNAAAPPATSGVDSYREAVDRAASATALSQIAQSQDDWRLTATRWQQAIALLGNVLPTDSNYTAAQAKLPDYRRQLTTAQQQAARSVSASNSQSSSRRTVTASSNGTAASSPNAAATPAGSVANAAAQPLAGGVFRVPIVRRAGGTPVISVTFNGSQPFDMILDTGASGTLVTSQMARTLNLAPAGQTRVNTASSRNVTLPLAYVNSMQVGGAIAQNVLVAVSGPELGIGLLGQDFFGQYDVTIRQNEVEFRAR